MAEEDHRRAADLLDQVNWKDRGDVLHQLWFLFNTYEDREAEKQSAFEFWKKHLAHAVSGMASGAVNTEEVPFGRGYGTRESREKAIFRLVMLGVVEEYAVRWNNRTFEVQVRNTSVEEIRAALRGYFEKYKFEAFAREMTADLPVEHSERGIAPVLHAAVGQMIDFVVAKRKQALRTMAELCRSFESDEQFRESILAYLQDSEFTPVLREWVGRSFAQVGLEAVRDVLGQLQSLEEAKRLVGTTRRMLDEDPGNVTLRLLSVEARLRSETEGDASVRQEYEALMARLPNRLDTPARWQLLVQLLKDVHEHRPTLFDDLLAQTLRRHGSAALVHALRDEFPQAPLTDTHCAAMTALLGADVLNTVRDLDFFNISSSRSTP